MCQLLCGTTQNRHINQYSGLDMVPHNNVSDTLILLLMYSESSVVPCLDQNTVVNVSELHGTN